MSNHSQGPLPIFLSAVAMIWVFERHAPLGLKLAIIVMAYVLALQWLTGALSAASRDRLDDGCMAANTTESSSCSAPSSSMGGPGHRTRSTYGRGHFSGRGRPA
jgi:hypothetical protein